jgi:hypothetical protein
MSASTTVEPCPINTLLKDLRAPGRSRTRNLVGIVSPDFRYPCYLPKRSFFAVLAGHKVQLT